MRWRPVAAAAVAVVAVIGLGAGAAAADPADESLEGPPSTTTTTAAPEPTGREDDLARAAELNAIAATIPPPENKPAPAAPVAPVPVPVEEPTVVEPVVAGVVASPTAPPPPNPSRETTAKPPDRGTSAGSGGATPAVEAPAATSEPVPVDEPESRPAPAGASAATATSASTTIAKAPDAAIAPTTGTVHGSQVWWPADVGEVVDQRLAEAWRETPVRGPPPGVASALGNDGRTTIFQVAIVKGRDGTEVTISASQSAEVNNAGVAQADARGSGSARATGDKATTVIYQTSVVVQRGSGTATVDQDARVDNLGYGLAASAGEADAEAVGNESATTVNQTAVVVVLGSGDAQVAQSTRVTNSGSAIAASTDRDSESRGNRSTTDVNQLAVVVVQDDDVTVNQTSTTDNIGMATATGGNATGNIATNRVEQVAVHKS